MGDADGGYTGQVQNRRFDASTACRDGKSSFIIELDAAGRSEQGVRHAGPGRPRLVRLPDAQADGRADAGPAQGHARPRRASRTGRSGSRTRSSSTRAAVARRHPRRPARRQDDRGERRVELARVDRGRRARTRWRSSRRTGRTPSSRAPPRCTRRTCGPSASPAPGSSSATRTRACAGRTTRSSRTTAAGTASNANHNYNWHDSIHSGRRQRCEPVTTPMAPCDDHGHGTHTTGLAVGDDGARQPDRRRARREVDRLPQHGPGHRHAGDVHGVLPVVHRSDRPQRPEPRSDAAAACDEQQLGLPASELCAPDSLQPIVENTAAAGIFVEVSAGNGGSGCSTVSDPPAIYDASYSTGA